MAPAEDNGRNQFYLTILKHVAEIKVDWKGVAGELGIKHPGNAQTKFNQVLKQDGFKVVKGSVVPLTEAEKTPATPRKRQKKTNTAAEDVADEGTPSKKQKTGGSGEENEDDGEQI
ncbi:hypothetical protein PMZ80_005885 [Knufia obscura]|uniref:Myb-like DNA-binding domain-containing protein n=2 Tax=Knufia TaxID=430999 RepID=A0AAN8F0L7_9EURO|nr:hypothetical protein PMZ80_005885 [Knufia obscura]KAK5954553.1 hypothetical protein OHC33_004275 [Knufia fluminis]